MEVASFSGAVAEFHGRESEVRERAAAMKQSIYSGEVFLTGNIVVTVVSSSSGQPVPKEVVTFAACALT